MHDTGYLICLWPSKNQLATQKLLADRLAQQGCIIKKSQKISLAFWKYCEFICDSYDDNDWAVNDGTPQMGGILRKALWCYHKKRPLTMYWILAPSAEILLDLRDQIRTLLCYGKHSIHVMEDPARARALWDKYTANPIPFSLYFRWQRHFGYRLQKLYLQCRIFIKKGIGRLDI